MDRETAFAKINLALHVRARRDDGYHDLETLFAFVEDGDELGVEASNALSLTISGPFSDGLSAGPDNLVLRAALALQARYGVQDGAAITLDKKLPIASGIGGGSADASATLRLLNRHWQIGATDSDLIHIAGSLGADVPACIASRTVIGTGIGDQFLALEVDDLAGAPILLINPRKPCATGPVFAGWDRQDLGGFTSTSARKIAHGGRNDLTASATKIVPDIRQILEMLAAPASANLVRMSGSGATCFALFETSDDRDAVADFVRAETPGYWLLSSRLR